ncbi:hypothetical protein SDC9_123754 [bioreactor metagenome]|uniref:Uncharacterized protein n=1 Tax=bioreactor metagenome TaxID=1076179 RepID=A0A645CII0_9ZZZZ
MISLVNNLHITVFNTIMHHLHEMSGAVLAHPVATGRAVIYFCGYRLEDLFHIRPRPGGTAGHHRRAEQCPFLAPGNAGTYIQQSFAFHLFCTADGIREMAVSSIYDNISGFKQWDELSDKIIYRFSGFYQHHYLTRAFERSNQFFE